MEIGRIQILLLLLFAATIVPMSMESVCFSCLEAQEISASCACCVTAYDTKMAADPCSHGKSELSNQCIKAYLVTYNDGFTLPAKMLPTKPLFVADIEIQRDLLSMEAVEIFHSPSNFHLSKLHFSIATTVLRI